MARGTDFITEFEEIATNHNTIPKVSLDGEPHEVLTLVAVLSGAFVAIILLLTLGVLIDCKIKKKHQLVDSKKSIKTQKSNSIKCIFGHRKSFDLSRIEHIATISAKLDKEFGSTAIMINENEKIKYDTNYNERDERGFMSQICTESL